MKKLLSTLWKDLPGILLLAVIFGLQELFKTPPESGQPMMAIAPGLIMGGVSAIQAIAGGIKARKNRKAAEKLEKNRPKYAMPKEVLDNQARAKNIAQGYDQARASGVRALSS